MRTLTLLLTLICAVSASIPNVQESQPASQELGGVNPTTMLSADKEVIPQIPTVGEQKGCAGSLGGSVVKKNLDIVFPRSLSCQCMLTRYSDPNYSDSTRAMSSHQLANSASSTNSDEKTNHILPTFVPGIQGNEPSSLGLGGYGNSGTVNSHDETNPYEGLPWADYPSSSDSGVSEETSSDDSESVNSYEETSSDDGDDKSEKITLPRPAFLQNIQGNPPVSLGLNDLDSRKKTDRTNMSVSTYADNTETEGPFTPVSKPCVREDKDIPNFAELVILNEEKINNSKIQREVYDNLFNIFYRINEAMIAYPEYLLKDRDKDLLEQFIKPTNLAMTSEQKQVLSNVIDGMTISLDEVKSLRQMVSNCSINRKARKAIKNVLAIREFNNSEKEILKIIKPLYSKQRKFLLSLLEVATKGVMAVPFKSGYAFDISDENIKDGLRTVNGDDLKCEDKVLNQESLTYSISKDLLTDYEIKKRNMLLSYNNYCWINSQLFGEECLNEELTRILCDVDNITDLDMLFAKLVRRVVKTFDIRETIESICGNEELDIQYDEARSVLRPRKRLYNKGKLADSIRNMLSEYNEEVASYSTYSVENLNQFQNYLLKVMHSDGISRHIAGRDFIVLCECKLTEGLEEDDITTTVKACIDIMNVISNEVVKEACKGCKPGIPDNFIDRISTEVWKDVICKFQT